jgi:hypothetical protein
LSFLRTIVLPVTCATPLWLWVLPVQFRGFEALSDFPPEPADWIFGSVLTLIGVFLVGLPAAKLMSRWLIPMRIKVLLLATVGAVGGAIIAILYPTILAVSAGERHQWTIETAISLLFIASFGVLPGVLVALVWIAFNLTTLSPLQTGPQNNA